MPAVLIVKATGVVALDDVGDRRGTERLGGTTLHCAKSIVEPDAKLYVAPSAYATPVPSDLVFHPVKEYPDREKVLEESAALADLT